MVSVVWRFERCTCVAAGLIDTSTMLSSGTVRPSGERTMKVAMSAMPYFSAPAKRTQTGTSVSPRRNSRSGAPRSASPTKRETSSALKPNAARALAVDAHAELAVLVAGIDVHVAQFLALGQDRHDVGAELRQRLRGIADQLHLHVLPGAPPPGPPSPLPMPMPARADFGKRLADRIGRAA